MNIVLSDLAFTYPGGAKLSLVTGRVEVPVGSAVAVIGGNGTGKTTLLRMLAGLLGDFEGELAIPDDLTRAFVPADLEKMLLPWYSVANNLGFFASRGSTVTLNESARAISELTTLLGHNCSGELLNRKLFQISTGQRAAVALTASMWRKPRLLFLDETFANASLNTAHRMIGRLRNYCEQGGTLFFTTHQLDLAAELATITIELENRD